MLFSAAVYGQGTVKGFISSESTGEAVMFASVSLEGTSHGVTTDFSGYYSLSRVPAGTYTLVVTSIEFQNTKEVVEIRDGKVLTKNFMLGVLMMTIGSCGESWSEEHTVLFLVV